MDNMKQQDYYQTPYQTQLVSRPQPINVTFTNHDVLCSINFTIRTWFIKADVPIVSVVLSSSYTVADAQYEGTLFGRSLAYLITDTVTMLNDFLPTINEQEESERGVFNAIMASVLDVQEWKVNPQLTVLGWSDTVLGAFFGSIRRAFQETKGRRA